MDRCLFRTGSTNHSLYLCAADCEITHAVNIRIYKCEGGVFSFLIRDSYNIVIYSSGVMRTPPVWKGLGGYVQTYGWGSRSSTCKF